MQYGFKRVAPCGLDFPRQTNESTGKINLAMLSASHPPPILIAAIFLWFEQ